MKSNLSIAKSSSVYETFSPLYKVLKLFGIIPFEMNLRNGNIAVNNFDLLWMLVMWVLWTYLIVCNIQLGAREPGEDSDIILTGWHWVLIFQLAASFYIQIVSFLKRKSKGELFEILHEYDTMVKDS
jgi:hypothetical protein